MDVSWKIYTMNQKIDPLIADIDRLLEFERLSLLDVKQGDKEKIKNNINTLLDQRLILMKERDSK